MRARPGFRVVLDREGPSVERGEPFADSVVEVDVGAGDTGEAVDVDGVVVVLAGDLHPTRGLVAHRVVGAVMPERELLLAGAEREAEDLMAETDAERRDGVEE